MKKEQEFKIKDGTLKKRLKDHLYSKKPILGEGSPFSELLQGMVNQMLEGEMEDFQKTQQLEGKRNKRNGHSYKQVISESGLLDIQTPRDRNGDFAPQLIRKRERDLSSGLDDQIIALYAQGNSIEDVRRLIKKIYGIEISSGKISLITDKVLPLIAAWQSRPLSSFYAVLYLDAVHFKIRHEGRYVSRAFYTVYSIDWYGQRDILGLYVQSQEGASKWGLVLEDLKSRGVEDVLVVCTDNLKGFTEVVHEVFPQAVLQKCIVHQVRNSLKYVDEKDRKKLASSLRKIYTSPNREQAQLALEAVDVEWGKKYGYLIKQWLSNWDELMAFMDFPKEMRRMIYTTNPVEAVHRIVRKLIKGKAAWVSDSALIKQMYLSLIHNEKSWKKKARGWISIQRNLLELYKSRIECHLQ